MITQDYLHSILDYNQDTGIFTWKVARQRIKIGQIAGTLNKGYSQIIIDHKIYQSHRLAWFYVYGYWPNVIDHINGKPNDNRISNLRDVSRAENSRNAKTPSTNTSGVKGVNWHKAKQKWRAVINIDGHKNKHLGYFDNLEEAKQFMENERIKLHGEFANHGTGEK